MNPNYIKKVETFLTSDDTREKRACGTLAGIQINRFAYLPCNPQNTQNIIYDWTRGGENTRLTAFASYAPHLTHWKIGKSDYIYNKNKPNE